MDSKIDLHERIDAFAQLKRVIENRSGDEREALYAQATLGNPWFTRENIDQALNGITKFLDIETLTQWAESYPLLQGKSKKVGVAMAGNIPLVGFHDLICVLISGHTLIAKLSSQDTALMKFMGVQLKLIYPKFAEQLFFEERLNGVEAVIATGSDNTSRYFEYYFRNIPSIIRKNRTSCAVLMGEEPIEELQKLGMDVFNYFGLGCRNVSKVFIPEGYDVSQLLAAWEKYKGIVNHHKYANNYDYQKCLLLMNQTPFYDGGQVLLIESTTLVSPISVVHYEPYKNLTELTSKLRALEEKLQCIVSAKGWYPKSVAFGEAQSPNLMDYADNIDTMKFLSLL
jgi:hypothetical protein